VLNFSHTYTLSHFHLLLPLFFFSKFGILVNLTLTEVSVSKSEILKQVATHRQAVQDEDIVNEQDEDIVNVQDEDAPHSDEND